MNNHYEGPLLYWDEDTESWTTILPEGMEDAPAHLVTGYDGTTKKASVEDEKKYRLSEYDGSGSIDATGQPWSEKPDDRSTFLGLWKEEGTGGNDESTRRYHLGEETGKD